MLDLDSKRICKLCGQEKKLSDFPKRSDTCRYWTCKKCFYKKRAEYEKSKGEKHHQKILDYQKEYRKKNKDKLIKQRRDYYRTEKSY